ncbi:hypothetical protein [Nocardia sp. CA-290969]|uniref:hypothetical protein n=1 Tax=Nocardia sp. CA-290969 TaxID=3239986 RepID=UPI003D93EC56
MNAPDLTALALADMRAGRRVLVIAPSSSTAKALRDRMTAQLADGETARNANGNHRITSAGPGWIEIRGYTSVRLGACRGVVLDRVYVDHSELTTELAMRLGSSRSADIVHI